MRRTIVGFSVRTDADVPLATLSAELEGALDCSFVLGRYQRIPAYTATVLGIEIAVQHWGGVGGRRVFRLEGEVRDAAFEAAPTGETVEIEFVDFSPYLVDLLDLRTPYDWYVPTEVDLAAEQEHRKEVDAAFE